MSWIIALASLGVYGLLTRRATERAKELAPTGLLRSPLYWLSNALTVILLALVMYIAYTRHQSPISPFVWFTAFVLIVALLVMRRALKWRYPV